MPDTKYPKLTKEEFQEQLSSMRSQLEKFALAALVHDQAKAEELADETICHLHNKSHRYHSKAELKTWVVGCMKNLHRNEYRREKGKTFLPIESITYDQSGSKSIFCGLLPPVEAIQYVQMERADLHRRFYECVDRLPLTHKTTILKIMNAPDGDQNLTSTEKSRKRRAIACLSNIVLKSDLRSFIGRPSDQSRSLSPAD